MALLLVWRSLPSNGTVTNAVSSDDTVDLVRTDVSEESIAFIIRVLLLLVIANVEEWRLLRCYVVWLL
jgi:hypothetical protein